MATIRVMSANIGNGMASNHELIRLIRESQADIVGVVELSTDQAAAVSERDDLYPHKRLYGLGIPGKGLLTHIPIADAALNHWHPTRPDLQAEVGIVGGQMIRIIVAHLPPQIGAVRTAQLNALIQRATDGIPTIMMGDFNLNVQYPGYHRLTAAGLIDAFAAAGVGRGNTYPLRRGSLPLLPVFRIDFIWHTPHFRTLRSWVGADFGSDHLPVFAELEC